MSFIRGHYGLSGGDVLTYICNYGQCWYKLDAIFWFGGSESMCYCNVPSFSRNGHTFRCPAVMLTMTERESALSCS